MRRGGDVRQQAADWLVRYDDPDQSEEDRAHFLSWLAADPEHRTAFRQLQRAWQQADTLRSLQPRDGSINPSILRVVAGRTTTRSKHVPFAFLVAASLTILVGVVVWLSGNAWVGTTYSTSVGGYERVVLSDGSVLQINTNSQIRVKFDNRWREIQLLRGEASFSVAKDVQRPFLVMAGATTVDAIGTAFSVRLRDDQDVDVVVSEGKVSVGTPEARAVSVAVSGGGHAGPPALSAGEAAVVHRKEIVVKPLAQSEVARRLAWQTGELSFKNQSLSEAVADINRYNRTAIEIVDPELGTLEVGGNFRATDIESFITSLQTLFPLKVEYSDHKIRLLSAKHP